MSLISKETLEHTCKDVIKAEKKFKGASKQILRALQFGENWGQEDRFNSACRVRNHGVPSMNQLVKGDLKE